MPTQIRLLLLVLLFAAVPAYSQETASPTVDDRGSELSDQDTRKGHGRPENPGAHGRQNAAQKQSRGHGNGSKQVDASTVGMPDEVEDDDHDDDKDNGKSVTGEKNGKDKKSEKQKKQEK